MTYNSLTPRLRLPYTIVRGSLQQRMQKSMECVDKLYRDFYPKYKNGKTSYDELQKSVNNVLGKKVNVRVQSVDKDNFMGGQDFLISEFGGKVSAVTMDLSIPRFGKIRIPDFITIAHEFQHVADQFFHPKYMARYQFMISEGMYNHKYNNLYDNVLYKKEYPTGRSHKKKILNRIKYKIQHFLRGMPVQDRINYIQDARYSLMSENTAYRTQYKFARIFDKKHLPVLAEDLEEQNSKYMLDEKIKLLTQMGFELIQKERRKMARMPKDSIFDK